MNTRFAQFALPLVLAFLSACGGSGDSDSSTPSEPAVETPALKSITVTPATTTLAVGTSQQLTATGTYADGKTAAITTGITWSTKGTTVLTLFTTGQVTGKAVGTDTVTAKVGDISGSATVTVVGPYKAIATGGSHTLAVKADGTLLAWGLNRSGQLGDGSAIDKPSPTTIGSLKTWSVIAAGEFHTVALLGTNCAVNGCPLYAWGYNQNGQLGDGTTTDKNTPTKIGSVTTWIAVAAGRAHTLAVKKDGSLWAWGRNFDGQLGNGSLTQADSLVPVAVGTAKTWKAVAAGESHSVGIQTDGSVWTWGTRNLGQTGQGVGNPAIPVTMMDSVPTVLAVPGIAFNFTSMAAGGNHSLAIRTNGSLYAWGSNAYGQLGNDTTNDAYTPIQIGTDVDWSVVAAGGSHSMGIKTDGTLWAWGSNSDGQLGDGSTTDAQRPMQIGIEKNWIWVSAGKFHTFAIKADGTLWGWGRNQEGQQGNGSAGSAAPNVLVPTKLN